MHTRKLNFAGGQYDISTVIACKIYIFFKIFSLRQFKNDEIRKAHTYTSIMHVWSVDSRRTTTKDKVLLLFFF